MSNKNRQHHTMFELHILLKHQRRRFLNDLQPIKMFNLDWHKKSQNTTEYFRVHASSTFFKNKFLNLLEILPNFIFFSFNFKEKCTKKRKIKENTNWHYRKSHAQTIENLYWYSRFCENWKFNLKESKCYAPKM